MICVKPPELSTNWLFTPASALVRSRKSGASRARGQTIIHSSGDSQSSFTAPDRVNEQAFAGSRTPSTPWAASWNAASTGFPLRLM